MKRFKVVNNTINVIDKLGIKKTDEMIVTVYNPPYEDENVLSRTKLKPKDVKVIDVTSKLTGEE